MNHVIDELKTLKEDNNKQNAELKELVKTLFEDFLDNVDYENPENDVYLSVGSELRFEQLGIILDKIRKLSGAKIQFGGDYSEN